MFVSLIITLNFVSTLAAFEETSCESRDLRTLFVTLVTAENELLSWIEESKDIFGKQISELKAYGSKLDEQIYNVTLIIESLDNKMKEMLAEVFQNMTVLRSEFKSLLKITDGGWSSWSNWTECPVTCLGGLTKRTRLCNNPAPSRLGRGCVGNDEEVNICNSYMCPDTDDCIGHKCNNGATCVDEIYTYRCNCPQGFTGEYCNTVDIDECVSDPCQNGATCTDSEISYFCNCSTGFTGLNCETDIDECGSEPCQNGAACTDSVASYWCNCSTGYIGHLCQTDIDECVSDPCQNGATCTDSVASYWCNCSTGYTGQHCETDIDECVSDPCQNGATCTDSVASCWCNCSTGYTGQHCETAISTTTEIPTTRIPSGYNILQLFGEDIRRHIQIGSRVVRGEDWKWGNQDDGGPGSVISWLTNYDGWVRVIWDHGYVNNYRVGAEGKYDLYLLAD